MHTITFLIHENRYTHLQQCKMQKIAVYYPPGLPSALPAFTPQHDLRPGTVAARRLPLNIGECLSLECGQVSIKHKHYF